MRADPKTVAPRAAALLAAAVLSGALSGCAGLGARPWDRDLLAKQGMQLNTHPIITAAREHIYFSKEGSAGGRSFDGGGCGCD